MSNQEQRTVPLLVEAAAVLLENANRSLLTTSLNKALFYLDVRSLLEIGKAATDATYVALRAGPVVESYHVQLIQALERCRIAVQDDDDPNYKPVVLTHPIRPVRLTQRQIELARDVATWAKGLTAKQLSEYSHKNPGWQNAIQGGEGHQIDLHLAMQQLLENDPWLIEPPTSGEKDAFDAADHGEAVRW